MGEEIHFLIFPFSGVHEELAFPHEVVNQSRNGRMKKEFKHMLHVYVIHFNMTVGMCVRTIELLQLYRLILLQLQCPTSFRHLSS